MAMLLIRRTIRSLLRDSGGRLAAAGRDVSGFRLGRSLARTGACAADPDDKSGRSGFTVLELVIALALLSMVVVGLGQVLRIALSAYDETRRSQAFFLQGRQAMERLALFARETDRIMAPASGAATDRLEVSERVLDVHDNATHAYRADGDGRVDADNDGDRQVNEDPLAGDPVDPIAFVLDKTDAGNWKLIERRADYAAALGASVRTNVICESVRDFRCSLLATNLVEIQLVVGDDRSALRLKTRLRSRILVTW